MKKKFEQVTEPVEGGVCLYKDGGSKVFTQGEAVEALQDGWADEPGGDAPKKRGRKPKVEEE